MARLRPTLVSISIATLAFALVGRAAAADNHGFPRTLFVNSSATDVARYDFVVTSPWIDLARWRAINPTGIVMFYPSLGTSPRPWPQGVVGVTYGDDAEFTGACDTTPSPFAPSLGCIRPFDLATDALHNADGSVARVGGSYSDPGWDLADDSHGTVEEVAKIMAYAAKQNGLYTRGFDGIWADNWNCCVLGNNWFYGRSLDANGDHAVDNLDLLRRQWNAGLLKVGQLLRSYLPNVNIGGNGVATWSDDWWATNPDATPNATMFENFDQQFYNNADLFVRRAEAWERLATPARPRYVTVLQGALDGTGHRYCIPAGSDDNQAKFMLDPGVMRSMRWGLTLAMMGDAYYEIEALCGGGASSHWWYDEYDGGVGIRRRDYLGQPQALATRLASGVWERKFQYGMALNNSTNEVQTVNVGSGYFHILGRQNPALNDGRAVSTVVIPPHDGVILVTSQLAAARTPSEVTGTCAATASSMLQSLPAAIGYWPLAASAAASEAPVIDASGHGNDGTFVGPSGDRLSGAFNGSYVALPALDLHRAFTLELWFKPTTLSSAGLYESLLGSDYTHRILWRPSDGRILVQLGGTNLFSRTVLASGEWHHVALVSDGTTIRLYLDGTADASVPQVADWPSRFEIGGFDGVDYPFYGEIAQVAAYPSALTEAAIESTMNALRPGTLGCTSLL